MKFNKKNLLSGYALLAGFVILATSSLTTSCNSGGASGPDLRSQPAPFTLEGVRLALWAGGPTMVFRSTSGGINAETGVDSGIMRMVDGPGELDTTANVQIAGSTQDLVLIPGESIVAGSYIYTRESAVQGRLRIQGFLNGAVNFPDLPLGGIPFLHTAASPQRTRNFEHNLELEFQETNGIVTVNTRILIENEGYAIQLSGVGNVLAFQSANTVISSVFVTDNEIGLSNGNGFLLIGYNAEDASVRQFEQIPVQSIDNADLILTPTQGDPLVLGPSLVLRFQDGDFIPDIVNPNVFGNESGTVFAGNIPGSYIYSVTDETFSDFRSELTLSVPGLVEGDTTFTLEFLTDFDGQYTNSRGGSGIFQFGNLSRPDPTL